jgi:NACHT domain
LWLHGIPGAGKTILASFTIQNVQRFAEASNLSDIGWAYYYCYFGRNQDESHPFLRWIISQLCRQLKYIPEELRQLSNRGTEPGYNDLLEVLSTIFRRFRRVYIVIDAVDESQDRRFLLDLLIKTASDDAFEKVRLLVMSRKELDIQQAFEGICTSISLSNPLVDEDIRVYIENQLQTDRKLSRWPEPLKKDIRDALIKGAKGMYVPKVLPCFTVEA